MSVEERLRAIGLEIEAGKPSGGIVNRALSDKALPVDVLLRFIREQTGRDTRYTDFEAALYERLGNFAMAEPCLRILIERCPDNPDYLSRLAGALIERGDISAGEDLLRNGFERWPRDYWINYQQALIPYRQGRFDDAYLRLLELTKNFPERPEGFVRLSDAASAIHKWAEAHGALLHIVDVFPHLKNVFSEKAEIAKIYKNLQDRYEGGSSKIEILFLNVDCDIERFEKMRAWYESASLPLQRLGALRASQLPRFVVDKIPASGPLDPGTLGCALSHIAAWERVISRQSTTLILEDDAFPVIRFGAALSEFALPKDFDLCFVNERMALARTASLAQEDRFCVKPVYEAIKGRPSDQRGVGTDGYLLSPSGAKKLLEWIAADGVMGHVDWQILSYCVDATQIAKIAVAGIFGTTLSRYINARKSIGLLNAFSIYPHLIAERSFNYSSRKA